MESKFKKCSVDHCNGNAHRVGHGYCRKHYTRWKRHGDAIKETQGDAGRSALARVFLYEGDDCLIWPLSKDRYGRGLFYQDGKRVFVSRLSCEKENGPPPTPKHVAAHSCGNGHLGCSSRKHLRWATQAENIRDTFLHGTANVGVRNASSKITDSEVMEIRSMSGKISQRKIAELFGISQANVSLIVSKKGWGHI